MHKSTHPPSLADFVKGKLSPEESLKLLDEIERDPTLSARLETANLLANLAETYGPDILASREEPRGWISEYMLSRALGKRVRYAALALAVCLFLVVGLFALRWTYPFRYTSLASIERVEIESNTRGDEENEFNLARQLSDDGKIDDAIDVLERFTRAYPRDEALDYAHLSAGALYLFSARRDVMSFITTFDKERVSKGLEHLLLAERTSPRTRLVEKARVLRAKGFLMLSEPDSASSELRYTISMHGESEREAKDLLERVLKSR